MPSNSKNMYYIEMFKKQYNTIVFIILVFILLIALLMYTKQTPPSIDTIWVINLDKDVERMTIIMEQNKYLPVQIQRWKAAYGKEEIRDDIIKDGVMDILSRSPNNEENEKSKKVLLRAGEIGCWLSHKRLLSYLSKQAYPANYGHLICEDDIIIDKQFTTKWNTIKLEIPSNWDIVYFGIGGVHGDRISKNVVRWKNDIEAANWGTHCYLVKNSSITKILDKLILMAAPIDVQYYKMLGNLNIYIVDPPLTLPSEEFKSSIDSQELRKSTFEFQKSKNL